MTPEIFRCELVSWHRAAGLARCLALRVRKSGFRPAVVVAIARGGYVPARMVCDYLGVYELTSLRVAHYTGGARRDACARLSAPLAADVRGRQVLLVDDVSDSGDTLRLTLDHLREQGPAALRVGVLHYKRGSTVMPDYYAQRVVKWRWITYPWAVVGLRRDYGMQVSEEVVRDALAFLADTERGEVSPRAEREEGS